MRVVVLLLAGSVSLADSLEVGGPSVRELPVVELPVTGSPLASVPLELALPGVVGWGSVALARTPSSLRPGVRMRGVREQWFGASGGRGYRVRGGDSGPSRRACAQSREHRSSHSRGHPRGEPAVVDDASDGSGRR